MLTKEQQESVKVGDILAFTAYFKVGQKKADKRLGRVEHKGRGYNMTGFKDTVYLDVGSRYPVFLFADAAGLEIPSDEEILIYKLTL